MPLAHLPVLDPPLAAVRGSLPPALPEVESFTAFGMRVSRQFAQCRRENGRLALLWVSVSLPAGLREEDRASLLSVASLRLRNRVRGTDEVVRVGEQGFAVLLLAAGATEAELVARRLLHTLKGAYGLDGRLLQLDVRLGRAVFPEDGRQATELAEAAQRDLR